MRFIPRTVFGLRCLVMSCPFVQSEDRHEIWAECLICGKRAAVLKRSVIRDYLDRQNTFVETE